MQLSPVKIVANPDGSLARAAATAQSLAKERRDVRWEIAATGSMHRCCVGAGRCLHTRLCAYVHAYLYACSCATSRMQVNMRVRTRSLALPLQVISVRTRELACGVHVGFHASLVVHACIHLWVLASTVHVASCTHLHALARTRLTECSSLRGNNGVVTFH